MSDANTRDATISPRERKQCSRCGAFCHDGDTSCWFCKREFSQSAEEPLRPGQFSLATLFAAMTVAAVSLGIFVFSPPLAIILFLFCGGALIRMGIVEAIRGAYGAPRRTGHFVLHFAASFGLVALAVFAWFIPLFIGFVVAAMGTRELDFDLWPIGGGFLVGLVFAGWILWVTRRVPMAD